MGSAVTCIQPPELVSAVTYIQLPKLETMESPHCLMCKINAPISLYYVLSLFCYKLSYLVMRSLRRIMCAFCLVKWSINLIVLKVNLIVHSLYLVMCTSHLVITPYFKVMCSYHWFSTPFI